MKYGKRATSLWANGILLPVPLKFLRFAFFCSSSSSHCVSFPARTFHQFHLPLQPLSTFTLLCFHFPLFFLVSVLFSLLSSSIASYFLPLLFALFIFLLFIFPLVSSLLSSFTSFSSSYSPVFVLFALMFHIHFFYLFSDLFLSTYSSSASFVFSDFKSTLYFPSRIPHCSPVSSSPLFSLHLHLIGLFLPSPSTKWPTHLGPQAGVPRVHCGSSLFPYKCGQSLIYAPFLLASTYFLSSPNIYIFLPFSFLLCNILSFFSLHTVFLPSPFPSSFASFRFLHPPLPGSPSIHVRGIFYSL